MSPLVWVLLLVAVGLALVLLEVFVPSGGVLGLLAVLALGAGIVTAFVEQGVLVGMGVLAGTLAAVPAVLVLAFRWFPSTPLGRRVLPPPPSADDVLPDVSLRQRLRGFVGRRGRAASELVPWGSVEIDEESFEAMSEGGPIAAGAVVEVVAVQAQGADRAGGGGRATGCQTGGTRCRPGHGTRGPDAFERARGVRFRGTAAKHGVGRTA